MRIILVFLASPSLALRGSAGDTARRRDHPLSISGQLSMRRRQCIALIASAIITICARRISELASFELRIKTPSRHGMIRHLQCITQVYTCANLVPAPKLGSGHRLHADGARPSRDLYAAFLTSDCCRAAGCGPICSAAVAFLFLRIRCWQCNR